MLNQVLLQMLKSGFYYFGLICLMRMSGKRLAGQTTTFDLIVLISLGVVLQTALLEPGIVNALTFIGSVLLIHKGFALACMHWPALRIWARGSAKALVKDGHIIEAALESEGVSKEDLWAGLRKLGYASEHDVKLAVLEETGHISAIGFKSSKSPPENVAAGP